MLNQLLIGIPVILLSGLIHIVILTQAPRCHGGLTRWAQTSDGDWPRTFAMLMTILWVIGAHLLQVVLWSVTYLWVEAFEDFPTTIYFTLESFTTVGFGDVVAPEQWRLLAGLTAANGMLAFGWSIAFQISYYESLKGDASND